MHLFVSDSREQLAVGLCSRGKDHLKGIVDVWDTALSCADEGKMQGLLKKEGTALPEVARYPEVYVLICCDLIAKFAPAQYQTSQQRANLMCPLDVDVHSEVFVRRYENLNDSVLSQAVSIIIEAPVKTQVCGPYKEHVRRRIQTTTPAVTTPEEYTVGLGEVELTQVMKQWMNFETLGEMPQSGVCPKSAVKICVK